MFNFSAHKSLVVIIVFLIVLIFAAYIVVWRYALGTYHIWEMKRHGIVSGNNRMELRTPTIWRLRRLYWFGGFVFVRLAFWLKFIG
jgi:hypothetical protein